MGTNQGSSTFRDSPDVALTADNVYTISDNGRTSNSGGTSCAAPLWAGFTALVNQQATNGGQAPVGFINPALYSVARGPNYSLLFHDITTGNNISSRSSGRYSAVSGFDLCTGWGTPTGALIGVLASPGSSVTSYTVSTAANPANGGTVTGGGTFLSGGQATVTATPKVGFIFTGWIENGNVVSASASYSFTVTANRTLVANFQMNATVYTITLSISPLGTGNVSGAGTFLAGNRQIVAAAPIRKYIFSNWTENGVVVSTSAFYPFTLDRDRSLVANFVPKRGKHKRR